MKEFGVKPTGSGITSFGISDCESIYWNLPPAELIEHSILNGEGVLTDKGALMVDTGEFTGRSPKDRFIVLDDATKDTVWWGEINLAVQPTVFQNLRTKMSTFCKDKKLYVRDMYVCADQEFRMKVRVISSTAFHNLFAYNMFIRPAKDELETFNPEFTILCLPEFYADPKTDDTRSKNFAILNMSEKQILIGGTGYTGEVKKGIFSVLNFNLPLYKNTMSMHSSANVGEHGDTAVFFGLSGTGKTTLSADPNRHLIGDDEHGWSDHGVFNFEGGCYAKVINLSKEQEPEIFNAIKFNSLLENTRFFPNTRTVDYSNDSVTQNTRVSYPIEHIPNALTPSIGGIPKNIFFLTADAFGVLPPISKLSPGQAMYHFISGYTARVAGTEMGITEPQMVFSTCFGAPFMPLHPTKYASLLGEKMKKYNVNVWLINTGWSGGAYGEGQRMKLSFTRSMITAAMEGKLEHAVYHADPVFGVLVPGSCPGVPYQILNPKATWKNKEQYDEKANFLAKAFNENFKKFSEGAAKEILEGGPKLG